MEGLRFLHDKKIVHKDIKGEKLFMVLFKGFDFIVEFIL